MSTKQKSGDFSDFEKEAMRDRAKELKAEAKALKNREVGEKAVMDAINAMTPDEKAMATKIHEIVSKVAPQLFPKAWYGMPAYTRGEGKPVCFFQAGKKYESRYCTLGFNDSANLDEGNMWQTTFALIKITEVEEKKIEALLKKAVS